jgi:signal transduction histidine kinase
LLLVRRAIAAAILTMGEAVDDRNKLATVTRQSVFELAHEIRNPLASIQGVADAFLQRGQLTTEEREWMLAVRREVSKINDRLVEMLDLSKSRVFTTPRCSLRELINHVVLLASHQVKTNREVRIEFIDDTTEPLLMKLDPAHIEDAVMNLVLNAIESIAGVHSRQRSIDRSFR